MWFRISGASTLDDWSQDPAWRARCVTPTRWLSTNHLVGAGYWVWLIPLSSGSHSVGIVADPRLHPLEEMNTFERAMQWLASTSRGCSTRSTASATSCRTSPSSAASRTTASRSSRPQRWALAGEAGRFLDPFYSPGSDFIAIGNTYITELIARDRAGLPLAAHTAIYEQIFRSFYDSTMALYVDQYPLFGDPEVLPVKILWDYTYYWSVLAQLFFAGRLADMAVLSHLRDELDACRKLNVAVQAFLRDWGRLSGSATRR